MSHISDELSAEAMNRLAQNPQIESLRAEAAVAGMLSKKRWYTVHGFYYRDPETGKDREGDVVARRKWFRSRGNRHYTVSLTLVVECKSLKKAHLAFPSLDRKLFGLALYGWVGDDGESRERMVTALRSHVSLISTPGIAARFERRTRPRSVPLVSWLLVEPPAANAVASAFRETSIGADKEVSQSVLWNASQGVRSAVKSMRAEGLTDRLSQMNKWVQWEVDHGGDRRRSALEAVKSLVRRVDLFHPVVVLDAPIWILNPSGLEAAPWVRLVQLNPSGGVTWWVDIVRADAFDEFAEMLSIHYTEAFEAKGMTQMRSRPLRTPPASRWR